MGGDEASRLRAIAELEAMSAAQAPSLEPGFAGLDGLQQADNVYLLIDQLPSSGAPLDTQASVPINVLLFNADSVPEDTVGYWTMALATGGSMLAPSEDWP
jgi:hypothetical protein